MMEKIYFIFIIILLSISFALKKDELSKYDLMDGVNLEKYISSHFNESLAYTGLKIAFLGNYKENTQLYFTYGLGFGAPYDKWEVPYFSTPIGFYHRTNFANMNMFFDYGVEGDLLVSLSDYSMSSYLTPELAMGIKIPLKKKK